MAPRLAISDQVIDIDGIRYFLNLSIPFDTTKTNLTSLFQRMLTTEGAVNNIGPDYVSGTMFANDHKFYTYGGIYTRSLTQPSPPATQILAYERYQYGGANPRWIPGFKLENTNNGVTRYVTHGAGVSVPSENKGFYFSGKRGENWGEIAKPNPVANVTSDKLITLDMSEQLSPKWANSSIDDVPGRAAGELVWIPVSVSGLLVAIGGVPHPLDISTAGRDEYTRQMEENNRTAPDFMRSVPVYDIDGQKWYIQNTTGDYPPQLAHFCSVVAVAQDSSSYNIYIYGGVSENNRDQWPNDDVHVLSIPSFTWTRVYDGKAAEGRHAHRCVKTYPDKMFVIGGQHRHSQNRIDLIRVFNLNTGRFQNTYHPEEWSEYEVPALVTAIIGGDGKGGAKVVEPSSWVHDELRDLFRNKYTKEIKTYYPYPVHNSSAPNPTTPPQENNGGGGGLPKWVAPVLGVVLGLIFITGLAVLWLLWRRRRDRIYATSEGATSANRKRIMGWMYGMGVPTQKTNMTTASTDIGIDNKHASTVSEIGDSVASPHRQSQVVYSDPNAQEAMGAQVHEMHAGNVSAPVELPTEVNVVPASPHAHPQERVVSPTPTFISPVSPEPPSPQPNHSTPPSRPTHGRNHSSLSSTGFNLSSVNNAPIPEEHGSPRRGYVSGFTEDLPSPDPEAMDRGDRHDRH
ncbi:hypothetical protein AJ79_06613 [Helicocarpus griseus UAMH5409]|uniref:Kelch repeat protein n=1 Tax=Helicocarpus griseus UAMH5409 TaxID=1447875 RepID=A0A2B7XB09_9EURO|nr:hypothetical protein AJ79_06613 [Helicocarpus griseus UAMH5409]